MILVSPAEPAYLRAPFTTHSLPEVVYGADFLTCLPSGKLAGIQRKEFPGDLLSSLDDGRLQLDLLKMQSLDYRILLLEGRGQWTSEGSLLCDYKGKFTRKRLQGLILSCQLEHGCQVLITDDQEQTLAAVPAAFEWLAEASHESLRARPKCPNTFMSGLSPLWAQWAFQSLPKCGPDKAERVVSHFGRLPWAWDCTRAELLAVPGVGKGLADLWMTCLPSKIERVAS